MSNILRAVAVLLLVWACPSGAQVRLTVAVPGPLNLSYLPIDLAAKIGADKAEGAELVLTQLGGGGQALQQLDNRNVDFAVAGVPAALSARARGKDVVLVAAVDDLPLFVFMVRADLKGQVKRPRDLKGRVVGVNTSSLASKTTSQQLAELILKNDGVSPAQVRIIAAGQSWDEQSSLILTKSADAILGDEPFASRLKEAGEVFFLTNLSDPRDAAKIPGAAFLHAGVETRSDVIREAPVKVEKMVAVVRRTLQWMAARSPQQIVDALGVGDEATRASLIKTLGQYPRLYSPDGKLSARQIAETDTFFAASEGANGKPPRLADMSNDHWAGRKP